MSRRPLRALATLVVSGLCVVYIVWKIDIRRTAHILGDARLGYYAAGIGIIVAAIAVSSWRWQQLLRAAGIQERLSWLTRTYYVSYAAAQVLPTSLGGDAARIYSTTRRHRGKGQGITGSVLLERALGGAATLLLAAIGFALAIGRYDVGAYLWIEAAIAVASIGAGIVLFSRRMRHVLGFSVPMLRKLRVERPIRTAYEGLHAFRAHGRAVSIAFAVTLVLQVFRVLAIWMMGKSVGVNLSPRPYYVLGPLLFLVMLVPFTINGIALREAFFVSFLGKLHVGADEAFATGFLFFLSGAISALPGTVILATESIGGVTSRSRRSPQASEPDR